MKKQYSFEQQLAVGKEAEQQVLEYLKKEHSTYSFRDSNMDEQFKGIDFVATIDGKVAATYEVKLDNYCQRNGKYYLEIELPNKLGWVHTCQADWLILVVGGTNKAKLVSPADLRFRIPFWKRGYGIRTCDNKNGYWSVGVCVPLTRIPGEDITLSDCVL